MILHTTARCISHPPCEWTGTTDRGAEKHGRETGHATIVETTPERAPRRIVMSRKHPWRADNPDAVIVARPSRWGNPYEVVKEWGAWGVRPPGHALIEPMTASLTRAAANVHAVAFYRVGLWQRAAEIRAALAGRDLACWCALPEPGQPDICHGAVLLSIANGAENAMSLDEIRAENGPNSVRTRTETRSELAPNSRTFGGVER